MDRTRSNRLPLCPLGHLLVIERHLLIGRPPVKAQEGEPVHAPLRNDILIAITNGLHNRAHSADLAFQKLLASLGKPNELINHAATKQNARIDGGWLTYRANIRVRFHVEKTMSLLPTPDTGRRALLFRLDDTTILA